MAIDTICFVPLLERFEAEYGTLNTLALFLGRESFIHPSFARAGAELFAGRKVFAIVWKLTAW